MKITSGRFIMHFPPVTSGFMRNIIEVDSAIAEHFNPLNYNPVPDDAPYDITRASTSAKETNAVSLQITAQSLILNVSTSEEDSSDVDKCCAYMHEKIELLYRAMIDKVCSEFYYSGLMAQLIFDDIVNPTKFIKDKFLGDTTKTQSFCDLNLRFTQKYLDDFYVNFEISNSRKSIENKSLHKEQITPLYKMTEGEEFLGVSIDVNDRYGFNYIPDYRSSYKKIQTITETVEDLLKGKIIVLLEKGEFDYDK